MATSSPASAAARVATMPAGPPPMTRTSWCSSSRMVTRRSAARGHVRELRDLEVLLVDRGQRAVRLRLAEERVEALDQRGVALLDAVGAVLHVQRLREGGLLQLVRVGLLVPGEDVVLEHAGLRALRGDLQQR